MTEQHSPIRLKLPRGVHIETLAPNDVVTITITISSTEPEHLLISGLAVGHRYRLSFDGNDPKAFVEIEL